LQLYETGGVEIYQKILTILQDYPRLNLSKIQQFSLAYGGELSDFTQASNMMLWALERVIRLAARGQELPAAVPQEPSVLAGLVTMRDPVYWDKAHENLKNLFGQAVGLHLNRKSVLQDAFSQLAGWVK